jgi:hypothetical protein
LCDANKADGIQTYANRGIELIYDNLVEQCTVLLNSVVAHSVYLLYFNSQEKARYKVIMSRRLKPGKEVINDNL